MQVAFHGGQTWLKRLFFSLQNRIALNHNMWPLWRFKACIACYTIYGKPIRLCTSFESKNHSKMSWRCNIVNILQIEPPVIFNPVPSVWNPQNKNSKFFLKVGQSLHHLHPDLIPDFILNLYFKEETILKILYIINTK